MLESGAIFDDSGAYRYRLWRRWDARGSLITLVMLNPSRADAQTNDPTIRRCIRFAQSWGYGALEVVNLFGYCTAEPKELRQVEDPVGGGCDRILIESARAAQMVLLAWGNHGQYQNRGKVAVKLLAEVGSLHCLGLTQKGEPRHPLYLKRDVQPEPYLVL
ncbi:MAG: DUF1643 domain-containing protein [Cyanobacteria bacterium P01_A01_bin.17]